MLLARAGLLPQALNDRISKLAFRFGLPVMLFACAAPVDYRNALHAGYVLVGVFATVLVVGLSWLYSRWRGHPPREQGLFVQGAYRSNLAIVGLALCIAAYGEAGGRLAALPVALMTTLYNLLAVFVLNASLGGNASPLAALRGVLTNPLIIGIAAGVALSLSGLPVPALLEPAGLWLSRFFLPLMLVCIGGAIRLSDLHRAGSLAWEATAWRLLVSPALTVALALALGIRGETLGVLFLLVATPAAASGYVMVVAARGNGTLAANIIVLTTLCSLGSITLGLFLLSLLGLAGDLS
ncbi:AEC family transporter [Mangrovimicrobium sediminis]|uniref:AEC family transporter n=2 Tax=Mangrovimicrobium sediminis TaxID=2562682 RepID=A0A4Z0M6A0_9GAMM|nr:AEC family transporter [Haliea sp. SAOS-164]